MSKKDYVVYIYFAIIMGAGHAYIIIVLASLFQKIFLC
jgi:hypothetical protein